MRKGSLRFVILMIYEYFGAVYGGIEAPLLFRVFIRKKIQTELFYYKK
ncbi:MAG: hypothetical protein ACI8YQ_004579 [Polaribacter sp.]|jgi:hypothetical protein